MLRREGLLRPQCAEGGVMVQACACTLPGMAQSYARTLHIPPDLVVRGIPTHRESPEVRICRLSLQSHVGTRPPSPFTPHCPACWVAYQAPADNVLRPLSTCPDGTNQSVINPRIQFFGASCHPVV